MKRLLSMLLVCTFILGMGMVVSADSVTRLTDLGILQGDEGGLRLEDNLTRGEFSALVARILRLDNLTSAVDTVFYDVKSDHWASGYINALYVMGLINGNGDGNFYPDSNITYPEAVKILVCLTGYDVTVDSDNVYPNGYLSAGIKLGITDGTTISRTSITRLEAVQLIDNTLDVAIVEPIYGTGRYAVTKDNRTLYDIFLGTRKLIEIKGVMIENEFSSLYDSSFACEKGYITVEIADNKSDSTLDGRVKLKVNNDYNDYLGCTVTGYVREEIGKAVCEVVSLHCDDVNTTITIPAEDVEFSEDYIEYYKDDSHKATKIKLDSDVVYMYNNRLPKEFLPSDKIIYNGQYRLIDNNDDNKTDVVFIDEYESFIVDSTNENRYAIYFANKGLFKGAGNIRYDIEDDLKETELTDANMEAMDFSEIEPGDGITIMQSKDGIYTKLMISKDSVTGSVKEENQTENYVVINEKQYGISLGGDGKPYADIGISDEGIFVLDVYGRIINVYGQKITNMKYGYVVAAKEKSGLENGIILRILNGAEPQKCETVKNGDVEVSYIFQNKAMTDIDVSSKAICYETYQGVNSSEHYVQTFSQIPIDIDALNGSVIGYTLNSDNEINKIYTYPLPQADSLLGNSQFNADILSFGGEAAGSTIGRGYATNTATQFICVPNHASPTTDDYFVQVEIDDESSGNYVYGVKSFFADTSSDLDYEAEIEFQNGQPVDVLVIKAEMRVDNPRAVSEDADVCIVGKVSSAIGKIGDDEGCEVYRIELLNGEEKIIEYTASSGKAFEVASTLIKGDLIQYNKDGSGRIAKIEFIGHIQGLDENIDADDEREHDWRIEGNMIFGRVKSIERNIYYFNYNENVELITLDFGNGQTKRIRIPVTDGPAIYLYEPRTGWIYPATADDIIADSSSICAYTNNEGMVTALVIIEY